MPKGYPPALRIPVSCPGTRVVPKSLSYWMEQSGIRPMIMSGFNLSVSISLFMRIMRLLIIPTLAAGRFVKGAACIVS